MPHTAVNQETHEAERIGPASACRANRSELSRLIRRVTDGVTAENQGNARHPGDLRVDLFRDFPPAPICVPPSADLLLLDGLETLSLAGAQPAMLFAPAVAGLPEDAKRT